MNLVHILHTWRCTLPYGFGSADSTFPMPLDNKGLTDSIVLAF